jgi:hypothetical protein
MSSILLCNSNGKQIQLFGYLFMLMSIAVNLITRENLNEFMYIYITLYCILLYLTCSRPYYFTIWWYSLGPILTYQQSAVWLNSAKGQPYPKAQTTLHSRFFCMPSRLFKIQICCFCNCAVLRTFCLYPLSYPYSLTVCWFSSHGGAVVASRPRALLWEIIPISKAMSSS